MVYSNCREVILEEIAPATQHSPICNEIYTADPPRQGKLLRSLSLWINTTKCGERERNLQEEPLTKEICSKSSPFLHCYCHKCCQKAIKKTSEFHPFYNVTVTTNSPQVLPKGHQENFRNFTLSTLLLSPLTHRKCCQKANTKKNFINSTLSTRLLSPLINHKCFQKAITKIFHKFHPFYNVTVTTNSQQVLPFLHHYSSKMKGRTVRLFSVIDSAAASHPVRREFESPLRLSSPKC